jgi:uncharacterized protein YjbJ (UPF0337 family)
MKDSLAVCTTLSVAAPEPRFSQRPGGHRQDTSRSKELAMGLDDKIKHEAEEGVGKAKEAVGDATDNERLEAEGQAEQAEANVKQAGDHVRDTAEDVKDALRN